MGHHYIPQKYLNAFAEPDASGMIWLYDKQGGRPHSASIAKVAQSSEFYTAEDEVSLASLVEAPANPIIQKLIGGKSISDKERVQLSFYIAVMLRRVPYRRRRIYEKIVPGVLQEIIAQVRAEILAAAKAAAVDPELVEARMAQLEEAQEDLMVELPAPIHETVRKPWPTAPMVVAIYDMAWRILETSGPIWYITTDNPAFYFEAFGLGTDNSELTFPLSTTHCLHGCWQGPTGGLSFWRAKQSFVKEVNRRVASTAERLGFYHQNVGWIQPLLQKPELYLSRIQW